MLSVAWMEIDLAALVRNARAVVDRAQVPLIPMIKADAYGLGAVQAADALEPLSPLGYGVATVIEGEELRAAGITRPIFVFTPLLQEEFERANAAKLTPTLGSPAAIMTWSGYERPYHLSIDTGMARAGVPWREIHSIADAVRKYPPAGAFTHFHSAELDDDSMRQQEERFRDAVAELPSRPPILHTDASAAIVRNAASQWDAVRPGMFIFGVGSGPTAAIQPEPVVYVKARIVEMRWAESGDTVSYDATWVARSRRLIATIPLGYADGYPRAASSIGRGIVRESSAPIAGRVTMDMTMLDVTDTGAEIGDVVTMIGDGSEIDVNIDVESVAAQASMSPYELLTGLRGRLPRVYRGS
jgi:alanine racemase